MAKYQIFGYLDFWNFHSTSTSTETSDGLPYETYGSINLKKNSHGLVLPIRNPVPNVKAEIKNFIFLGQPCHHTNIIIGIYFVFAFISAFFVFVFCTCMPL